MKNQIFGEHLYFMDLLNNLSDIVILLDNNIAVKYYNKSFSEWISTIETGTKQYLDKPLCEVLTFLFDENRNETLLKSAHTDWEEQEYLFNSKKLYLEIKKFPLQFNDTEEFFVVIIKDSTSQREQEEYMNKLVEELSFSKDAIENYLVEMHGLNYQLAESEENLKNAVATKDKFFSIIAHDLKNPLGSFGQLTELLMLYYKEMSDEDIRETIETLDNAAKFAFELLENLLQWSRSQTGKIEFHPEKLDVSQLLKKTVSLLKIQASRKNIEINSNIPEFSYIVADRNMLDTIFRNLISNAIKFSKENSEIIIRSEIEDNFIKLAVQDKGIGMTEEDKTKLFRIDVQHTTIGTSKEQGTGLGLILCREFVEKHKGKIWVESTLGQGSTFNFTMPLSYDVLN